MNSNNIKMLHINLNKRKDNLVGRFQAELKRGPPFKSKLA